MNRPVNTPNVKLEAFRTLLARSIFIETNNTAKEDQELVGETAIFDKIPDFILEKIFNHNFGGDLKKAERILFNRYHDVERIDLAKIVKEKQGIFNLEKVATHLADCLDQDKPILFITDNDNDGSLAQAILIEFSKLLPPSKKRLIHVEYAMPLSHTRGITCEMVELAVQSRGWHADADFTIITADNGINNREEQHRIHEKFPNAPLIISDHHLPDPDLVVQEDELTMIFNPKYQPTPYFQEKNISGADTLGVLLKETLTYFRTFQGLTSKLDMAERQTLKNITEIGLWANLLDYANADISDMPVRPYIIEKALNLRPLLNVSTSMANLVTLDATDEDIRSLAESSGGLDAQWVRDRLDDVKALNIMSQKLLGMYTSNRDVDAAYSEKEYYQELSAALMNEEFRYTSINPNYIEQLRPIIFNLSAIDNKDQFKSLMLDTMTEVFEKLRRVEREILNKLRDVQLLNQDIRANSNIMYPVNESVSKIFNRRLLGKAYNRSNNGFTLILGNVEGHKAIGSMRSLYSIEDILKGKEEIEEKLNIKVSFMGHEMAAGFFVTSTTGESLTNHHFEELNTWIDNRISRIKLEERINQMPNLEIDFASVHVVNKLNKAVKANLAGMYGLPTVMRFSPTKNDKVFVTDNDTTAQIDLAEVVSRKKFGYQAIATDFHDGAIVLPVEILRSVVESNYQKGIRLSYMDEGVFMANQVVEIEDMPQLIPVLGDRTDQQDLIKYYQEVFKESNFIDIDRQQFIDLPYFKYNDHGKTEFERWESLVISILDLTKRDVLAVVDTEGTGLGKAPKCFNLGGTNLFIDPNSGEVESVDKFNSMFYRNAKGDNFLLNAQQKKSMLALHEDEDEDINLDGKATFLIKNDLSTGADYSKRYFYPGDESELLKVTNLIYNEDIEKIVYNRHIAAKAYSFLVNNKDFAITKEFENLTGISNGMVEKLGIAALNVDKKVDEFYRNWKNESGEPVKIIFQAHNMPYDRGVVNSNFQRLLHLFDEHITSDTAKLARKEKLAYDDTPVCSFDNVEGLPPKAYFYNSPYSDYSMKTFLLRCARGKGGVFPDIKAKILLRYNAENEQFSVIDRSKSEEYEIQTSIDKLTEMMVTGALPNNAVRYSVERMSLRAMVRNILLMDLEESALVKLQPNEEPYRLVLEHYQKNYHFDSNADKNIINFSNSIHEREEYKDFFSNVDMIGFTERFLAEPTNRTIQARFHDGWIYEKVLLLNEPSSRRKRQNPLTIEQINYLTDLPSKKIREVNEKVIQFKRKYNIHHAIVHEQHNNIRMTTSEDGQGLADTAYECVLPQHLGIMKFFNPYMNTTSYAAEQFVSNNMRNSLIQHMLGDDYTNEIARDSYSMDQMLVFSRREKTDQIRLAENIAAGKVMEVLQPIKFRLSTDLLPPDTAIYGTPTRHITQAEVKEISEKLEFIMVNEQMKSSALNSGSLDNEHCKRILAFADNNDEESIRLRNEIMQNFSHFEFSRRDEHIKKLAKMLKETFEGGRPDISKTMPRTVELAETLEALLQSYEETYEKIGLEIDGEDYAHAKKLVENMLYSVCLMDDDGNRLNLSEREERLAMIDREIEAKVSKAQKSLPSEENDGKGKAKKAAKPRGPTKKELEISQRNAEYQHQVKHEKFFDVLKIERREPIKFALRNYDLKIFFPALLKLEESWLSANAEMAALKAEVQSQNQPEEKIELNPGVKAESKPKPSKNKNLKLG